MLFKKLQFQLLTVVFRLYVVYGASAAEPSVTSQRCTNVFLPLVKEELGLVGCGNSQDDMWKCPLTECHAGRRGVPILIADPPTYELGADRHFYFVNCVNNIGNVTIDRITPEVYLVQRNKDVIFAVGHKYDPAGKAPIRLIGGDTSLSTKIVDRNEATDLENRRNEEERIRKLEKE
ncbi:hypothetical protein O181_007795 [Austropuccinia psidii MF-1]|uniref:Uncharacterized protein n=1 Tax=Austropuccinia psidii MF-1 TaxID=1389203 RepID=A0A9Q3BN55_9BASI|nr:hypothetical protein [Austropuccinia psidii MF-1]